MKENRTPAPKGNNFSRRRLITGAGAAGGGLLLSSAWPSHAFAHDDDDENQSRCDLGLCEAPNAIPHVNKATLGAGKFHFYFPGPVEGTTAATDNEPGKTEPGGRDPSAIYNFKGFIGQVDLNLTGTGTDLNTGISQPYSFHTDSRFMAGEFLGTDGRRHRGTFALV